LNHWEIQGTSWNGKEEEEEEEKRRGSSKLGEKGQAWNANFDLCP